MEAIPLMLKRNNDPLSCIPFFDAIVEAAEPGGTTRLDTILQVLPVMAAYDGNAAKEVFDMMHEMTEGDAEAKMKVVRGGQAIIRILLEGDAEDAACDVLLAVLHANKMPTDVPVIGPDFMLAAQPSGGKPATWCYTPLSDPKTTQVTTQVRTGETLETAESFLGHIGEELSTRVQIFQALARGDITTGKAAKAFKGEKQNVVILTADTAQHIFPA